MGYIRHHAIIVTGHMSNDAIERAHEQASELGMMVTDILDSLKNGYRTFFVAPDGSKEGWGDSTQGDQQRDDLIMWLEGEYLLEWCEVQYGDDDNITTITRYKGGY